jgi:predicted nicotinamide N-methyase
VDVELNVDLSFRMQECLFQARPNHWSRIWPSSLALSRWLLDQLQGSLPASARELGCGLGLVTMTLAHLGVLAHGTDREPRALAYALANARDNAVHGCTFTHLDWSEPHGEATQLMVASDVLYEKETPARLFDLLETGGLLAPQGRLLIGGPRERAVPLNLLVLMLRDQGYTHHQEARVVEWQGRTEEIDVHVLARPAKAAMRRA